MGFPSPAGDYMEQRINLNDLVRGYPSSTIVSGKFLCCCAEDLTVFGKTLSQV